MGLPVSLSRQIAGIIPWRGNPDAEKTHSASRNATQALCAAATSSAVALRGLSVRRIVSRKPLALRGSSPSGLPSFGDNHRRLIERAVLSWGSLLKIQRVVAVMIGIVLPLLVAGAQAAELKVYASTAVKAVLEELGPQFEKATGDKLVFTFDLSAAVKKQIDEGAAFDVAILTLTLTNDLATADKIDPASRVAIARAGSGVAVLAGSPKPDVSTAEALKRTLLQAKSIGFTGIGSSRPGNEALLAKLGIADQVKPKIKLLNESAPVAVAKGEVEIGLGLMSEVLLVPGVRLAGPFPAGLQSYVVFMAGVSSASKNADAARSLIKFLTAPAAAPVLKAKDMEPG